MTTRSLLLAAGLTLGLATAAGAQAPAPANPAAPMSPAPMNAAPMAPETTGSVTAGASNLRQLSVDALGDMDLVSVDGKDLGEIEGVVEGSDGRRFLIVERGGFLGFGSKEVAIPLENVAIQGDRLMLRNMDMAALEALPAFENEGNAFREIEDDQQIGLAQQQ